MDAKRTGSVGELAVATKLTELGFTVSWPLTDDAYDLIAEKDGHSRRVQVKSATLNKGGSYRCALHHCKSQRRGYNIPIEDIVKSKSLAAMVFPAGKGKGNIMVCKWEKYKDGWKKI